jgi:quercetin dioxygenase-like cupin family protein
MKILTSSARESEIGKGEWFTGDVWLDEIALGEAPSNLRVHCVTFSPTARTAWHAHPLGQILHAQAGVGRVQMAGGPVFLITPGDSVWISPGERHWHGAAPDRVFVHLAVQEATSDGEEASWFEHVTDQEYASSPQASR